MISSTKHLQANGNSQADGLYAWGDGHGHDLHCDENDLLRGTAMHLMTEVGRHLSNVAGDVLRDWSDAGEDDDHD